MADATLYSGRDVTFTIGTSSPPTTPVILARDATVDFSGEMLDGNYKGAGYFNVVLPGKQSGSITFECINDPDDVALQTLVLAKAERTKLYWKCTSDATASMVASGAAYVESASWSQPLDGVQTVSFTLTTTGTIVFTAA